jgi:hypothetical protein
MAGFFIDNFLPRRIEDRRPQPAWHRSRRLLRIAAQAVPEPTLPARSLCVLY